MTAFTPAITIYSLPPNTAHSATKTEVTDWIDYSISISRGSSEYIQPPYPGQTEISLLFDVNVIPDIELGSWLEIHVDSPTWGDPPIIYAGNVTNRTSAYRAYGLAGFVLEWRFTLTSGISILQNTSWYNPTTFTGDSNECLTKVFDRLNRVMWNEINASLTWENYGPETWEEVDQAADAQTPDLSPNFDTTSQTLTSGYRNVWEDYVNLVYGVYGWIFEAPDNTIEVDFLTFPSPSELTLTQDMLNTDIMGGDRFNQLRNQITITEYNGTESTYYDNISSNLYNERAGTLQTYMNATLDAANVGQKILNGMAYPLLSTEQVSLNLLNPIFTDAERDILLYTTLGRRITVEAPLPMGGTLDYLTIGCQFEITKDAFLLSLTLAPYTQAYSSINWEQVPYNYTWTSYGVAYPTQIWSDL